MVYLNTSYYWARNIGKTPYPLTHPILIQQEQHKKMLSSLEADGDPVPIKNGRIVVQPNQTVKLPGPVYCQLRKNPSWQMYGDVQPQPYQQVIPAKADAEVTPTPVAPKTTVKKTAKKTTKGATGK